MTNLRPLLEHLVLLTDDRTDLGSLLRRTPGLAAEWNAVGMGLAASENIRPEVDAGSLDVQHLLVIFSVVKTYGPKLSEMEAYWKRRLDRAKLAALWAEVSALVAAVIAVPATALDSPYDIVPVTLTAIAALSAIAVRFYSTSSAGGNPAAVLPRVVMLIAEGTAILNEARVWTKAGVPVPDDQLTDLISRARKFADGSNSALGSIS